jgi:prepilin-type N-terminal cleavage/methylation domain-containing protein
MKLNRKQEGFTIVELLIVIIVIAILATLVLVTFTGTQQSARNTQRQTDIKAVASHLETYNAKNSYYPALADLNNEEFISDELKGLDRESTKDPKGTVYTFNNGNATSQQYGYTVTNEDDGECDNAVAGNECTKFTLSYQEEGGELKTVSNL